MDYFIDLLIRNEHFTTEYGTTRMFLFSICGSHYYPAVPIGYILVFRYFVSLLRPKISFQFKKNMMSSVAVLRKALQSSSLLEKAHIL